MKLSYYQYKGDKEIAVDIESKDPLLKEKGPGVYRKDGYVTGVSFSNGELSEYYPINHFDVTPEKANLNRKYIIDQLSSNNHKIFANGLYDLDWLINYEGIPVNGVYNDVQIAEPLIDEYKLTYSLDSLGEEYLGIGKNYRDIKEYMIHNGIEFPKGRVDNKILYTLPALVVAPYGAQDALLTYKVFQKQKRLLEDQNLMNVYDIEMRLFPLLLQMRRTGVRVDKEKLYKTGMQLDDLRYDLQDELNQIAGRELNANSGKQLEKLFLSMGHPVEYNEPTELMIMKGQLKGNPKFDKETLSKMDHDLAKKILEIRHISTLLNMFIHPYPELMVGDRLHCSFNQLRSDDYGTVSGRFSSSNPNLQQVSGKNENEYIQHDSEVLSGQVVRKLFVPEEGCDWLKMDWSQIEYRLIAHYASGEGSEVIRQRYINDPNVDYHAELMEMTGIDDRKVIKTLNFGAAYGMGITSMSRKYNWELEGAKAVYEMYHSKVPFVKETGRRVASKAKRFGYIRTILNRRARMPQSGKEYIMFNRLIQGSAADIMKKSMVDAYEAGVFDVLIPHLTVHDEMDCSMPRTEIGRDAGEELKHIMETSIRLRVPVIVDAEIGENWGDLKEWKIEYV